MTSRRQADGSRHRLEVVVSGELVDVLDALVALSGRRHPEVASDLLEESLVRVRHGPRRRPAVASPASAASPEAAEAASRRR